MVYVISGLLLENSKLLEEKRELEKLFARDKEALEGRVRDLETALEDHKEAHEKVLEEKKVRVVVFQLQFVFECHTNKRVLICSVKLSL